MTVGLVDSHVHLHAYDDYAALLARAGAAGVERVVAVGVDLPTSRWNVARADERTDVVAAVGVHPIHLHGPLDRDDLAELERLARQPAVQFIGEIGVDTIDASVDVAIQIDALEAQLAIAQRAGKPVNLHLRGAIDDALRVLHEPSLVQRGAICHYFVGDEREARRLLEAGLYLSVGKPATRLENVALRRAIQSMPLDRLLLETDSYPLPGRTTEPADLPLVAQAVAELRGSPIEAIAEATTATFYRLVDRERA